MGQYRTGLHPFHLEAFPIDRCCGAGWEAIVVRDPHKVDISRSALVIKARRPETAQRALELIWIAMHVLSTEPMELYDLPEVRPADENSAALPSNIFRSSFHNLAADRSSYSTSGIPLACHLAARCSRSNDLKYALHLLGLSQSIAAIHVMDLDPSHWREDDAVSPFERDQVRLSNAIINAYAVIEQLQLEVRASASKPTFIKGNWNPIVRQELEDRLLAAGINLKETFSWTVRGPRPSDRDPAATAGAPQDRVGMGSDKGCRNRCGRRDR